MDKYPMEALIMDYWDENNSPDKKKEIEKKLLEAGYSKEELLDLKAFYSSLDDVQIPEPRDRMTESFYKMLTSEQSSTRDKTAPTQRLLTWWQQAEKRLVPKMSYAFLFVILGWALGTWITPDVRYKNRISVMAVEITEMKEMVMLNLLEQTSPSKRMKALNLVDDWNEVDTKVVRALMQTLNYDPNVNVRLVTVATLARFTANPAVREGLIRSINRQQSPLVQLALADLMVSLHESESVPQFQRLLEKKDLNYEVRNRINEVIRML